MVTIMDKAAYFEQLRQKRRNDILDAAQDMILQQGMDDFNIQQLARKLDLSTVTLYKYFKNSEDIALALQERILETQKPPLPGLASDGTPLTLFSDFHRALYRDVLKNREHVTLLALFETYLRNKPRPTGERSAFWAYASQIRHYMEQLLEEAQSQGLIPCSVSTDDAFDFIMNLNVAFIRQIGLMDDERFKLEEKAIKRRVEQLLDLFLLYLKTGGTTP